VIVIASALTLLALWSGSHSASAGTPVTAMSLTCSDSSVLGTTAASQQFTTTVKGAPPQSLPGAIFSLAISDLGESLPSTMQGFPIANASNVQVMYQMPTNATFVSATLSGGTGVGSGATVTEVTDPLSPTQNDVVESVPGPIAAGASFALPTINLTLAASQTAGSTIDTGLLDVQPAVSSTISSDPAFIDTLQVTTPAAGSVAVNNSCWPSDPNPTILSSTSIVSVVTTPPAITINTPVNGAVYTVGQAVVASYDCTDVASYGVATCSGSVPSGSAIDTSTAGEQTFTVNATDLHGTPEMQTVSYYVQAAPTGNVTGPSDAGTLNLVNGTSCNFGGNTCPVQTAPEATYEVESPVPNGGVLVMGDTFSVQWQIYEPSGDVTTNTAGMNLDWILPAPSGTVIDGPVTTSDSGLVSPAVGQGTLIGAGQLPPDAGVLSVNGMAETGTGWTYDAVGQSSLDMIWAEFPAPGVGTAGLYLDVSYTVKVTSPGTVTLPGFPALTSSTGLTTAPVDPPNPAVSFDVVDPTPPSVSIASPADGAVYSYGQVVDASYSCADPFVTVTSCAGTVASGTPIDSTSAIVGGLHTFIVTATDSVGNTAQSQVEYFVHASPPIANPQSFSVPLGADAKLPILTSDAVTDYPFNPASVKIVTPPSDGTVTTNTDGSVTFADDSALSEAEYAATGSMNDSFTYTVSDTAGDVSNITTVSLIVLPQLVIKPIDPSAPSLPQGLTLQQTAPQPSDSMHEMSGSTCGGSAVVLSGQPQIACGEVAPVTITNDGAANSGWTLTGQVSDFLDGSAPLGTTCEAPGDYNNHCIPGGDLGWSPSAVVDTVLAGSAAVVQPGTTIIPVTPITENSALPGGVDPLQPNGWPEVSAPGTSVTPPAGLHDLSQILCDSPDGASEGSFTCGAELFLPVPASSAASEGPGYQATLTLTLMLS
jgi:dehydratase